MVFSEIGDRTAVLAGVTTIPAWVCWPVSGSTCAPGVVDVAIIPPDKSAGTNTLRHSHARHLLVHGIPINHLPTWLQLCDTESGS